MTNTKATPLRREWQVPQVTRRNAADAEAGALLGGEGIILRS